MSLRILRCSAIVLASGSAACLSSPARAGVPIDTTWLNATNGLWGTAGNWDTGVVPNNMGMTEYNAFITVGGALYTVDLDLDVTINNLTIDNALGEATLRLNGFDLTLAGGLSASNNNTVRGDGLGELTLAAASTSTLGGVRFMNVARVRSSGNLILAGAGDEFCDTDIDHEGTSTIEAAGEVILNGNSIFRVTGTGILNLNNSNSFTTAMGTPTIVNNGTIVRGISAATFTIDNVPTTNNGTIRVGSGTLLFSGAGAILTNPGTLDIESTRTLELASGATLSNFNAGALTGGIYNVKGTFRLDTGGAGIDTIAASVTLNGAASAIQNADNSNALAATDTIAATGTLTLLGTRSLTTGGNFDNQGMISINPGSTFEVPMGSTLNNFNPMTTRTLTGGRFEVHGTGLLRFDAGAMGIDTVNAELILDVPQGSMPVRNSAGANALTAIDTIGNNGRIELASGFDFSTASSFAVAANGELVIGEGSEFVVPNVGGNQLVNFGGNIISDGSFEVRGILRAPGLAVQTIGIVGNPSQIVLDSQLFSGMMPVPHFQDNAAGNADAFAALQTIEIASSLTLRNGAMLSVPGALTVRGSLRVTGSGPGPLRGTLLPSSLTVGGVLTQELGAFELGGGVLNLGDNFLLGENAKLAGTGNVNFITTEARGIAPGSLVWDGAIAPGAITGDVTGALDIDGDAAISSTGAFEVSLGGLIAGDTYDQLRITGIADLDGDGRGTSLGELRVSLVLGYVPVLGNFFDVMLFASRQGEFQDYFGMSLPNGLSLEPIWGSDRLTLIVVPGPGALSLLAVFFGARRRKR